MGPVARIVGGVGIVVAPLLLGVADQVRMAAEPPAGVGAVDASWGVEQASAQLVAIEANAATFATAGWLAFAGTLVSVPALVAIWWLAVTRAPRWAWAGAVLAVLGVLGAMVHLSGYYGQLQVLAAQGDPEAGARLTVATEGHPFLLAIFLPFLLGLLAPLPQAVGLRRARVLPLWACLAVVAAAVLFLVLGSTPWSSAASTVLLVAGFAPAALAMLRGPACSATPGDSPTVEPSWPVRGSASPT